MSTGIDASRQEMESIFINKMKIYCKLFDIAASVVLGLQTNYAFAEILIARHFNIVYNAMDKYMNTRIISYR